MNTTLDSLLENLEMTKIYVQRGLATLEGKQSPTNDTLLLSVSLTLWYLELFSSVNEVSAAVRKIICSGKAEERFNRPV